MAKVDDLLERRAKQVVLAIVARLAHRSPPTANLAVEGITDRPNQESQTAIKPACTPGFLAQSITCSGQIIAIDQSLPNSSRTTRADISGRLKCANSRPEQVQQTEQTYSITSSARASSLSGTVRPRILAVW